MLKSSYVKSGFPIDDDFVAEEAGELLRLAVAFPADAVIEKRGDQMQQRA